MNMHAQGWREVQERRDAERIRENWLDQFNTFEGIFRAALWGGMVWIAFACLMVLAWGVMA
jgi:hypothetical protein